MAHGTVEAWIDAPPGVPIDVAREILNLEMRLRICESTQHASPHWSSIASSSIASSARHNSSPVTCAMRNQYVFHCILSGRSRCGSHFESTRARLTLRGHAAARARRGRRKPEHCSEARRSEAQFDCEYWAEDTECPDGHEGATRRVRSGRLRARRREGGVGQQRSLGPATLALDALP